MTASAAVYVLRHGMSADPLVRHALGRLRCSVKLLIVVHEAAPEGIVERRLADCGVDRFVHAPGLSSTLAGYRAGLLEIRDRAETFDAVVLTSDAVFGPIGPVETQIEAAMTGGTGVLAPYWYDCTRDVRLLDQDFPDRLPHLDFAVVTAGPLGRPEFWTYWECLSPLPDFWTELTVGLTGFARMLQGLPFELRYACGEKDFGTPDPRITEVDSLLRRGVPCFPIAALHLDPLIHDLMACDLRAGLDSLRAHDPELYAIVVRYALHHVEPRRFAAIADEYEVISTEHHGSRQDWSFGQLAVFIHAYYTEMMPEFWAHIEKLPSNSMLYISTATEEGAQEIEAFLEAHGRAPDQFVVRKVEQNRGRDMSALFITFRDIILENRHSVALRLHSKRTPHMPPPVAEEFRKHMFDNVVPSEGFVENILDLMDARPDIGLLIPPVVHIGFSTLGHSWFGNRDRVAELANLMGLNIVLDEHTPVAPYGTMYWFRTRALRKMFEWAWQWEHYNPEPNHVDGGLAHAQERLIGYCVQDAGYRIVTVMSPRMTARNYAKLEYKLQALISQLPVGSIADQYQFLKRQRGLPPDTYDRLRNAYGRLLTKFPLSRKPLRPLALFVKHVVFFQTRKH